MLKRETVERLAWEYDDDGEMVCDGESVVADVMDGGARTGKLLASAPKLALACLEALALTRRVVEHFADTDAPLGIAAQDVRSLLFNELTAAGVEVE